MFEKDWNISYLLDFYGEILSEKKRGVMELYYNEDLSLSEIAEQIGISRQGVRDIVKKTEEELFFWEEKLGLAARFIKMRDKSAEIASELDIINSTINNDDISSKILSLVNQVKEMAEY